MSPSYLCTKPVEDVMKVYCNNCKYGEGLREDISYCAKVRIGEGYTNHPYYLSKKTFNDKGECKDYKRKWFSFWIKEKP